MVNLLTLMEYATFEYFSPEDKGIMIPLWDALIARCGFSSQIKKKGDRLYYKLKRNGFPYEKLYSRDDKNTFNYIDMADLHIGHPDCEEEKIKQTLRYAEKHGVEYIFIAGDLFNGIHDPESCYAEEEFNCQIARAFRIFRIFPTLKIRVIPGNHEFTFDLCGYLNPLKVLEKMLKRVGCDFKAYDSYIQDFEIAGIIKRMMHLECYYHIDNDFFSLTHRLSEFNEQKTLSVKCKDLIRRPVRFLQCGHVHKSIELFDSDFNVYITQPGSFIRDQSSRKPFIHVKGEVLEDLRIVRG